MGTFLRFFVQLWHTKATVLLRHARQKTRNMRTLIFGISRKLKPLYLLADWFATSWQLFNLNFQSATSFWFLVLEIVCGRFLRDKIPLNLILNSFKRLKTLIRELFGELIGVTTIRLLQLRPVKNKSLLRFGTDLITRQNQKDSTVNCQLRVFLQRLHSDFSLEKFKTATAY